MRTPRLLPKHQRHLHSPRRRSCQRDALHNPRPARELHHKWRPLRVLQLHHTQTGRLLRRRTPHLGPDAFLKRQPPFLHSHRPIPHRSRSLRPPSRRPQVRRESVQTSPQQEVAARVPVLFASVEDVGCVLYTDRMEEVEEEEVGGGVVETGEWV